MLTRIKHHCWSFSSCLSSSSSPSNSPKTSSVASASKPHSEKPSKPSSLLTASSTPAPTNAHLFVASSSIGSLSTHQLSASILSDVSIDKHILIANGKCGSLMMPASYLVQCLSEVLFLGRLWCLVCLITIMSVKLLNSISVVQNALVTMYSRSDCIGDASIVFERIAEKDLVSWGSIIAALAQKGHQLKALHLFKQMLDIGDKHDVSHRAV
ncbi:hypothetical protein J5N97_011208 [Dioscorea zingiberensis]|uniref:Pentatricopeptide repeat-containing protein n=1 Tax=Dioscorea zingiberensis TaxID=325984 RepID=A0A9D5HND9_9LILI|nr:hypothetical protein J5N97_011208 [Dioscorea zingiberensis]